MESKNFVLQVINGTQKSQIFDLESDEITIGRRLAPRERKQDWILIEDSSLARKHAILKWDSDKGLYRIILTASNKNLILNGEPVEEGYLYHSDKIQLGDIIFRIWDGKPDKNVFIEDEKKISQKTESVYERSSRDIKSVEAIQEIKAFKERSRELPQDRKLISESPKEKTRTFGNSSNEASEVKPFSFFNKSSEKQQEESPVRKERKQRVFGNVNNEEKKEESGFKPISLTSNSKRENNSFVKQSISSTDNNSEFKPVNLTSATVSSNDSKFNSGFKPVNLTSSTTSAQNSYKEVQKEPEIKFNSFEEKQFPKKEEKFSRIRSREDRIEAIAERRFKEEKQEENFDAKEESIIVPEEIEKMSIQEESQEDSQSQFSKVPQRFLGENRFVSALISGDSSESGIVRARESDRRHRRTNQEEISENKDDAGQIKKTPSFDDSESEPFEAIVNNKSFTSNKPNSNLFQNDLKEKEETPINIKPGSFFEENNARNSIMSNYQKFVGSSNISYSELALQQRRMANFNSKHRIGSSKVPEKLQLKLPVRKSQDETSKSEKPILEKQKPILEKPILEKPTLERPTLEKPTLEKPILEKPILGKSNSKQNVSTSKPLLNTDTGTNPVSEVFPNSESLPFAKQEDNSLNGAIAVERVIAENNTSYNEQISKQEDNSLNSSIFADRVISKNKISFNEQKIEKQEEEFQRAPFFIDEQKPKNSLQNKNNAQPVEPVLSVPLFKEEDDLKKNNNIESPIFEKTVQNVSDSDPFSLARRRDERLSTEKSSGLLEPSDFAEQSSRLAGKTDASSSFVSQKNIERPSGLLEPSDFAEPYSKISSNVDVVNSMPIQIPSVSPIVVDIRENEPTASLVISGENQSAGLMIDPLAINGKNTSFSANEKNNSFDPFSTLLDLPESKNVDNEIRQANTPSFSMTGTENNKNIVSEIRQLNTPSLPIGNPENRNIVSEIRQLNNPRTSMTAIGNNKNIVSEIRQLNTPSFQIGNPENRNVVSEIRQLNRNVVSEIRQLNTPNVLMGGVENKNIFQNIEIKEPKKSSFPFEEVKINASPVEEKEEELFPEIGQKHVSDFAISLTELPDTENKRISKPIFSFDISDNKNNASEIQSSNVSDIFSLNNSNQKNKPSIPENPVLDAKFENKHKRISKMRFSGVDVVQKPVLSSAGFTNAVDSDIKTSDADMEKFLEKIEQNREENQNAQRFNSDGKNDKNSKTKFFGPASSIDLSFSDYKMQKEEAKLEEKNKKSEPKPKEKKEEVVKEEPKKPKKLVTSVSLPPLKDLISNDKKDNKEEDKKKDKKKSKSSSFAFEDLFVEQASELPKEEKKKSSYFDNDDFYQSSSSSKKSSKLDDEMSSEKSVLSMFLENKEKQALENDYVAEDNRYFDWYLKFVKMPGMGMNDSFDMERDEMIIGRGSSADLCLKDMALADRHVKLYMQNGELYLQKLDRKKQIFINGTPLISSASRVLNIGDRIQLSDMTVFEIQKK